MRRPLFSALCRQAALYALAGAVLLVAFGDETHWTGAAALVGMAVISWDVAGMREEGR